MKESEPLLGDDSCNDTSRMVSPPDGYEETTDEMKAQAPVQAAKSVTANK
jgi:hypothetical protein